MSNAANKKVRNGYNASILDKLADDGLNLEPPKSKTGLHKNLGCLARMIYGKLIWANRWEQPKPCPYHETFIHWKISHGLKFVTVRNFISQFDHNPHS